MGMHIALYTVVLRKINRLLSYSHKAYIIIHNGSENLIKDFIIQ